MEPLPPAPPLIVPLLVSVSIVPEVRRSPRRPRRLDRWSAPALPPFPPPIVPVAWLMSDPIVAPCAFRHPAPPAPPRLVPLPPPPPLIAPLLVNVAIVPAFQTPRRRPRRRGCR